MEMPFICLYKSYLTILAPFTDSQLGRLIRVMLAYSVSGEVPELRGSERFIWPMLQDRLDRDEENYRKRCAKNRANAAKGGRPKNQSVILETDGFSEKPKKPKENKNENEKENENKNENKNGNKNEKENKNENEIENEKENENEQDSGVEKKKENKMISADKPGHGCDFSPPTKEELETYCARQGFSLDTGQFLDYYESNGWMVGRNKMRSWQAVVRNWVRKERQNAAKSGPEQVWGTIGTVL